MVTNLNGVRCGLILLLVLSGMIAPLVGLKTEQASIGQSQIGASAAYIAGRYDSRIGLVSESEDMGLNVVKRALEKGL